MFRELLADEKRHVTPELYYRATRTGQRPPGVRSPSAGPVDAHPRSEDPNAAGDRVGTDGLGRATRSE